MGTVVCDKITVTELHVCEYCRASLDEDDEVVKCDACGTGICCNCVVMKCNKYSELSEHCMDCECEKYEYE